MPNPPTDIAARLHALRQYLDQTSAHIRDELADPRAQRDTWRLRDLEEAQEHNDDARAALALCPAGADLALLVRDMTLALTRHAAANAARYQSGTQKGGETTKAKRHRPPRRHTVIRALGRKLDPDLSVTAKAERLHRQFPQLSVRTLRRILSQPTSTAKKVGHRAKPRGQKLAKG